MFCNRFFSLAFFIEFRHLEGIVHLVLWFVCSHFYFFLIYNYEPLYFLSSFFPYVLFSLTILMLVEQGYCSLPAGVRMSSTGRTATYEQALAWKVLNDSEAVECIAFLFINWSLAT